jgi:hypothetical protein
MQGCLESSLHSSQVSLHEDTGSVHQDHHTCSQQHIHILHARPRVLLTAKYSDSNLSPISEYTLLDCYLKHGCLDWYLCISNIVVSLDLSNMRKRRDTETDLAGTSDVSILADGLGFERSLLDALADSGPGHLSRPPTLSWLTGS